MTSSRTRSIVLLFGASLVSLCGYAQQTKAAAITPLITSLDVTTTGGTSGQVPVFNGASSVTNSNIYTTSFGIGINHGPGTGIAFDVLGKMVVRGIFDMGRSADATTSTGTSSNAIQFHSQVYSSSLSTYLNPFFELRSEPVGNNSATPSATFHMLYSSGTDVEAETGLYFNGDGTIHFAPAQTFPITTGATGPAGPQGPTGPTGPQGPQGPAGPAGTIPANLTAVSGQLSTNGGVAYLGNERFEYGGTCVIGDVFLSVNGYGSGNAIPADGRTIPIIGNTALFALIGTNFGGNGTTNYAMPDLRAFAPKGMQYSICLNGIFPASN